MWWREGVVHQVYPRSFADGSGDGVGDLAGLREHLDHLAWLGVDAVWLSPIFRSPMRDFGYDISDYPHGDSLLGTLAHAAPRRAPAPDVDPLLGPLADLDRLVAAAHERGLRLILDFVPNHTSSDHPWFVESRSSRDNPKRNWYVWRDPAPDGGPPNNWRSAFGDKSAWQLDERTGQYYLHVFLPEQVDLDWTNPEVRAAMLDVMRFWFERGIDGFRIDVINLLSKDPELRDEEPNPDWRPGMQPRARWLWDRMSDGPAMPEYL